MEQSAKYMKTSFEIVQAAYELLSKMPKEEISVKSICELTGINRSTFYAHFKDLNDVYSHIDFETIEALKKLGTGTVKTNSEYFRGLLERISKNIDMYRAVFDCGLELRFEIIFEIIYLNFCPKDEAKLLAIFLSAGVNDYIKYWINHGPDRDINEISEGIMNGLLPTFRKFKNSGGHNNE